MLERLAFHLHVRVLRYYSGSVLRGEVTKVIDEVALCKFALVMLRELSWNMWGVDNILLRCYYESDHNGN